MIAEKSDGSTIQYAILLSDTVVITPGGTTPDLATLSAHKNWKDVAYFLKADKEESEEAEESEQAPEEEITAVRKSARTEQVDFKAREEER